MKALELANFQQEGFVKAIRLMEKHRGCIVADAVGLGKTSAYKINHARVLLLADSNQENGGWIDQAIASTLNISISIID